MALSVPVLHFSLSWPTLGMQSGWPSLTRLSEGISAALLPPNCPMSALVTCFQMISLPELDRKNKHTHHCIKSIAGQMPLKWHFKNDLISLYTICSDIYKSQRDMLLTLLLVCICAFSWRVCLRLIWDLRWPHP